MMAAQHHQRGSVLRGAVSSPDILPPLLTSLTQMTD